MNQDQKIKETRAKNTATIIDITELKEDWLLEISGIGPSVEPGGILDWEKISPKRLSWPAYLPWGGREKVSPLVLPERLTNPQYGSAELEQNLREMAKRAPGIHKVWEMTKDLPSLTKILLEEREQE